MRQIAIEYNRIKGCNMKFYIEDKYTEFKLKFTPNLKKEIIAFANTDGGTIYVGVTDKGVPVGVEDIDSELLKITGSISQAIAPDLMAFTDITVEKADGVDIIKVKVQKGVNRPYYLKEKGMKPTGVYVRLGAAAVPAGVEQIRQLIRDTDGVSFEKNVAFNQALPFSYLDRFLHDRGIIRDEEFEKGYGIKNRVKQYTNLAYLLSDNCQFQIRFSIFSGTDKNSLLCKKYFDGSVIRALYSAFSFLEQKADLTKYPKEVLFEALSNALIHREYGLSAAVAVNIFSDRIEISSPGGICNKLTLEDITTMGISQSRNSRLANFFVDFEISDGYGLGLARIMSFYKGVAPKAIFKHTPNAFMTVLRPLGYTYVKSQQTLLFEFIENKGGASSSEIQDFLGYKQTKTYHLLTELCRQGLLTKEGKGKNTRYFVTTDSM